MSAFIHLLDQGGYLGEGSTPAWPLPGSQPLRATRRNSEHPYGALFVRADIVPDATQFTPIRPKKRQRENLARAIRAAQFTCNPTPLGR